MSEPSPFVSIVVPARNAARTLGDCLASLLRLDYPAERHEILVVDNASTDQTAEIAARHPVACVREQRRGPGAARNRGIAETSGEIVAFTDADCTVTTQWLRELVRGFDAPAVAGVGGEIVSFPPATPAERYRATTRSHAQRSAFEAPWPWATTANVAFRRDTFTRVGVFDPELPTGEDKDFSWRVRAAGLELRFAPRALVLHRHRPSAWTFFRQQAGWGYGAALLHAKYDLPWGFARELGKYGSVLAALGSLGRACLGSEDVSLAYHELLRRTGLRAGAAAGLLATRRRKLAAR